MCSLRVVLARLILVASCLFVLCRGSFSNGMYGNIEYPKHTYKDLGLERSTIIPHNGLVPDEETAIAIAVAVWSPIYGKNKIKREKPYHASLEDGIWTVRGSVEKPFLFPRIFVHGGSAIAELSQKDGHIIRVFHDK